MPSFLSNGGNAVIANGATVSSAVAVDPSQSIVGIVLPAAFTGIALTFQASADGVTYTALKNPDGTSYSLTVAQGTTVAVPPANLCSFPFYKLVSGTAEGAARVIGTLVRNV